MDSCPPPVPFRRCACSSGLTHHTFTYCCLLSRGVTKSTWGGSDGEGGGWGRREGAGGEGEGCGHLGLMRRARENLARPNIFALPQMACSHAPPPSVPPLALCAGHVLELVPFADHSHRRFDRSDVTLHARTMRGPCAHCARTIGAPSMRSCAIISLMQTRNSMPCASAQPCLNAPTTVSILHAISSRTLRTMSSRLHASH